MNATRRRPLALTDRQLEAINTAVAQVLADTEDMPGREFLRMVEVRDKVQAEMIRRNLFDKEGYVRHTY